MNTKLPPDVLEVIEANRRGCHHERQEVRVRSYGTYGSHAYNAWVCLDCKQVVRPWDIFKDDPRHKALAEKLERGHAYMESIGKKLFDTLTSEEQLAFRNAQMGVGDQFKLVE